MGPSWLFCSVDLVLVGGWLGSKSVPGVVAVAARRTPVAMWLVRILIRVLVVLVGVLLLPAVLRARGYAVASLVRPLVVVVLVRRHQVAPLVGGGVVAHVVALSHSLALLDHRKPQRRDSLVNVASTCVTGRGCLPAARRWWQGRA